VSSFVTASTAAAVSANTPGGVVPGDFITLLIAFSFLVLLIAREANSAAPDRRRRLLARGLTITVLPLGYAFVLIAAAHLRWALE
jgi:hypothetical protein